MERHDDNALIIYTDGSSTQSPRRGGVGFMFVTVDEAGEEVVHPYDPDGFPGANNQEMELKAVIEALKTARSSRAPFDLSSFNKVVVFSDSQYVVDGYQRLEYWNQQRWMKLSGGPIVDAELWKQLRAEALKVGRAVGRRVKVHWVPGKKNRFTKQVDKLAKGSGDRPFGRPVSKISVRRKLTEREVDPGCVPIEGQELEIRVITTKCLSVQRLWRYKYEVIEADSRYFGYCDLAVSSIVLGDGHSYRVRFNDRHQDPRILEAEELVTETADDAVA